MADPLAADPPRRGSSVVPKPLPLFAPRTDSERLRLAALASNTDDSPTIISANKPHPSPTNSAARVDLRGRRLGHFELIEPIGVGGMAAVIKALDLSLCRDVALKILPPEAAQDAEHVARFQSEARAAAKLDHENIARVYFCGEDQGLNFIAFEFVEGENLRAIIDRRGTLPPIEAVHIMLQVTAGLAHAAERGVVHRDVKPSNIIVTPSGRAKLVDMGLARHLDGPADGMTQSGVTLGTFDYISPEQALEPRQADVRSDIYSLGCTFYHALTGHPPVPEGTAAKKLDAHQHIEPIDPRQLNPVIPNELAAILGRMMAKDPNQRYQTPEQLLDHLVAVAQKLEPDGATSRSVLFIDSPLPTNPPRLWLWTASTAALVVATIVAVMETMRPATPASLGAALLRPRDDGARKGEESTKPESEPPTVAPAPAPRTVDATHTAATADELRTLLHRGDAVLRVKLTGTEPYVLDRRSDDPAGLTFVGKRLEIEAADPINSPAVIRWNASADDDRAALTVGRDGDPGILIVKGVRFEITTANPEWAIAAIVAREPERVEIDRCTFVLPDGPAFGRGGGALVVEGRRDGDAATVAVRESLFVRGPQAFHLAAKTRLRCEQCAFGPSAAVVFLHATGGAEDSSARLEHCSVLLESGAVFALDDRAGGTLLAGHCLFSRPAGDPSEDPPGDGVLIRQLAGGKPGDVVFKTLIGPDGPQRNAYHNLSAFWSDETPPAAPRRAVTLDDARRRPDFKDDDALELPQSPWQLPRPTAALAETPRTAFAVDLRLPRLRVPRAAQGVIGVTRNVWGASYKVPLDPPVVEAVVARTKVVDPSRATDATLGTYRTLEAAILDAKPNDTVLIRVNGRLEVEPVRLDKPDVRLTVKPFANYRPLLVLTPAPDAESALFRLYDGQLHLEGLHFGLRPVRSDVRFQSVVAIAGTGQAEFRDCIVTLEEGDDAQLAVVNLPDIGDRPAKSIPSVRLESTFVRGKGDLFTMRGGRRFELETDNTLVALDGCLIKQEGVPREPQSGPASQVRLKRTTALLSEQVLFLKAARDEERGGLGLPSTSVVTDSCVIAALSGRSLVRVEGVDSDESARQLVMWSAAADGKVTYIANTGPALFDMQAGTPDRIAPMPLDQERWLSFMHERASVSPFVRLRFAVPPTPEKLARMSPPDFRIRPPDPSRTDGDVTTAGAAIDRLPRPGEAE
ncbi:MAG: serine/threonine-protein kinase [Gemmataceae bacterium]